MSVPVESPSISENAHYTSVETLATEENAQGYPMESPTTSERAQKVVNYGVDLACLLYTSPSPRDRTRSRMPSSA